MQNPYLFWFYRINHHCLFSVQRSIMQSYVYKTLFSYSVSKRMSIRLFCKADKMGSKRIPTTTLQHRFIKYFEKALKTKRYLIPEKIQNTTKQFDETEKSNSLISKMKHSNWDGDVSVIIDRIQSLESSNDPEETRLPLIMIDEEICRLLNVLSFEQNLLLLNKLMEIVPHKLVSLNAYKSSIDRLRNMLPEGTISSDKIVNLLFLAGFTKTAAARDVAFILKYLPDMKELSLEEKCIVSMTTFKAGVKLDKNNIQTIEDTIHANLELLMSEGGLFVSLLKSLRFGGPTPEFSLTPLSQRLMQNKRRYEISLAVPILALYAEMLKYEKNVVRRLIEDSISDIRKSTISTEFEDGSHELLSVRTKDVDRLLWATSRLNHKMTNNQLAVIDKFLESRLSTLSNEPKIFVGMLLSLWMLRSSKCREKIEYCFREKTFEPLLDASLEDQLRFNLLLACVRIEEPSIKVPSIFASEMEMRSMKPCRELQSVSKLIKCLSPHLALYDTRLDCPIKEIRIYGISTRHETLGGIHIDISNNVTCLKDTYKPNGLFSLKLRLIKALGYFSILLRDDELVKIESMIETIEERINSMLKKLEG